MLYGTGHFAALMGLGLTQAVERLGELMGCYGLLNYGSRRQWRFREDDFWSAMKSRARANR